MRRARTARQDIFLCLHPGNALWLLGCYWWFRVLVSTHPPRSWLPPQLRTEAMARFGDQPACLSRSPRGTSISHRMGRIEEDVTRTSKVEASGRVIAEAGVAE
jgi:hypothetical protein